MPYNYVERAFYFNDGRIVTDAEVASEGGPTADKPIMGFNIKQVGMTFTEYQDKMTRTYKPNRQLNHILGLCGEAGEVAELIKKAEYHDKPYSKEAMKSELGDELWYLTALITDEGLTLDEVAKYNVEKLEKRYPEGFVKGGGIR